MKVRRAALNRIGEHTIRTGAPMATIEEPLVPIYMYHRYAVEGAGVDDRRPGLHLRACAAISRTPTEWGVGRRPAQGARRAGGDAEAVGADGSEDDPRSDSAAAAGLRHAPRALPAHDRRTFDPLTPATIAADVTIGFVLQPDRAARMVAQHAVDPSLPGLDDVIDRLTKATFDAQTTTPYEAEVRRAEERVLVDRVMWLATGRRTRRSARLQLRGWKLSPRA